MTWIPGSIGGTGPGTAQEVFTTLEPPWPYLGQSHAGGIVLYVDGTGQHGLVAAPSDRGNAPWGCAGTSVATGTAVGTGAGNTAVMIAPCADAGTAARLADGLVLNGYSDWLLPSRDEFALIPSNLQAQGLGGIANWSYYWTSSQSRPCLTPIGKRGWAERPDASPLG